MWLKTCAATLALAGAAAAAAPLHFNFDIAWQTGPLATQASEGRFTIDSTLVVPGAEYTAMSLLSSFSLQPAPGQVLALPVDTGWMRFGNDGTLTGLAFGSNCNPSCSMRVDIAGEWWFNWTHSGPRMAMASDGSGVASTSDALSVTAIVPEPGAWVLWLLGLPLLALARKASRQRR